MAFLLLGFSLFTACRSSHATKTLRVYSLNDGWEFRAEDNTGWLSAKVPGGIHTDLSAHGLIPDPYFGTNEMDLQWIGERSWEYRLRFDLPRLPAQDEAMVLVFDGLDTYARVFFNGKEVLAADNMFVRWEVELRQDWQEEENELRVVFSPTVSMDSLRQSLAGWAPPSSYALHRKAAYHFGWDWGPRFLDQGIWKAVRLEFRPPHRISDVHIRQDSVSADRALLTAVCALNGRFGPGMMLEVRSGGKVWTGSVPEGQDPLMMLRLELDTPSLWWPRGLGPQDLQDFKIRLLQGRQELDVKEVVTGLRSLALVQDQDSCGRSFRFRVNGRDIFARGANLIPLDMFPARVAPEEYEYLVRLAAEAGVNMLRVWGGGIYEDNLFYELCDRYGILVWQDFMFACSMYPADSAFLQSVAQESQQQVQRLRNHPCLALWCGNNENWVGWNNWGWKDMYTSEQQMKVEADYALVFDSLLPEVVHALDPGKAYWPSSPLHNWAREDVWDGGDLHYWGVWHGEQPFDAFTRRENIGRFVSEFGMQSMPAWHTLAAFLPESSYHKGSPELLSHQKHRIGYPVIDRYMVDHYPLSSDLYDYLHLTRALQARGMETAIAAHRRHAPCCAGSLFWQWNDVWPGATWSAIDGEGRPKPLYYRLQALFDDVLLFGLAVGGEVQLFLTSDTLSGSAELELSVQDFHGREYLHREQRLELQPDGSVQARIGLENTTQGIDPGRMFWKASVHLPDGRVKHAHGYFAEAMDQLLPRESIEANLRRKGSYYELVLSSPVLIRDLEILAPDGVFLNANGFDLLPGEVYRITVVPENHKEAPELKWWTLNAATHR